TGVGHGRLVSTIFDSTIIGLAISAITSATSLPRPSEADLAAMQVGGVATPLTLWAVASIAYVIGSCVIQASGRYLSHFADRKWFPISPQQMEKASAWYARFGWPSLLFSWVPVVGDPLTVVAGLLRTRFVVFVIVVAMAKTARYAAILWLIDLI